MIRSIKAIFSYIPKMETALAFVHCAALFVSLLSCLSFTKIRTNSLWNVLSRQKGFQTLQFIWILSMI